MPGPRAQERAYRCDVSSYEERYKQKLYLLIFSDNDLADVFGEFLRKCIHKQNSPFRQIASSAMNAFSYISILFLNGY